jgi:hypothetical protein
MPPIKPGGNFAEIGHSGLRYWSGRVFEEWLPELAGTLATKIYREMMDNDAMIGSVLFAIEMLMRQAEWHVEPASENKKDQDAAEFLEQCMDDMSQTWHDTIGEIISFLPYGWSAHEIVYKRRLGPGPDPTKRSKHNDGKKGWRKLATRSQDTLLEWIFDDDGGIKGIIQSAPPDYAQVEIPIEKLLLFRSRATKNNPEGRSVLRNAYRSWYFKKRIEEIEGIGIERDLAGLPTLTPPEGLDIWNQTDEFMTQIRQEAEALVKGVRRDEMEGIVLPFGWTFTLLNTGAKRQFDVGKVIERYDQRIAMTVLADFILLGHEKVGSFALSSDKTDLFAIALGAWMDSIEEVFNRYAVPRLFDLNPDLKQEELPKIKHGDLESPNLTELSTFIKDMTGVGVLVPDPELEAYLREVANLPERNEDDLGQLPGPMIPGQPVVPGAPGTPAPAPRVPGKAGAQATQGQVNTMLDPSKGKKVARNDKKEK